MRQQYFAARAAQRSCLEVQIMARMSLALIAEKLHTPFVYTPLSGEPALARSEYPLHALDSKWQRYFSLVASDFRHVNTLEMDEVIFFSEAYQEDFPFLIASRERDAFEISAQIMEKIKASRRRSFVKPDSRIHRSSVLNFIEKSHSAYTTTFGIAHRKPFEHDTLKASVVMEDDPLRGRYWMDQLTEILDFFALCARMTDSEPQVHIFSGLLSDAPTADDFQRQKADLKEACAARPYVIWHDRPSFEALLAGMACADINFAFETHHCQFLYGTLMTLLSGLKHIRVEMVGGYNQLALNHCFVMGNDGRLLFEEHKLRRMLQAARGCLTDSTAHRTRPPRLKPVSKPRAIRFMPAVIDGLGSYFMKVFVMQVICDYYGLSYIHCHPPHFDHVTTASLPLFSKARDFFTLGAGRTDYRQVFGDEAADLRFFRLLPPLAQLKALDLTPRELVVAKIATLRDWPLPKHYLSRKMLDIGERFQRKHAAHPVPFEEGVLNVALHLRHVVASLYQQDAKQSLYARFVGFEGGYDFDHLTQTVRSIHDTLQTCAKPFCLHVYTAEGHSQVRSLEALEHVRLHVRTSCEDDAAHFIALSQADMLFPAASYMSLAASVFSKPSQIAVLTESAQCLPEAHLILAKANSVALSGDAVLKDAQQFARLLPS